MSDSQQQNRPGQDSDSQESQAPVTPAGAGTGGAAPVYADQVFRSYPSVATGAVILLLVLWMCVDAMLVGKGRAPLEGAAVLLLLAPLIGAFTLWPCVRANAERLIVRNPFRTVTARWTEVESLQAALSVELRSGGRKYQVWALPVSMRQRKRGNRQAMRQLADPDGRSTRRGRFGGGAAYPPPGGPGLRSRGAAAAPIVGDPTRAWADGVVDKLNELREQAGPQVAGGAAAVRWTWGIIVPAVVGAISLIVLLAG